MVTVRREVIAFGDYGSLTTLNRMRGLVHASLGVPLVNETAHQIVAHVPPRDYMAMSLAIRQWLQSNFRFVPDPVGVELLREPETQLRQWRGYGYVTGDCDDVAVLGAALAMSVGIGATFVGIGFTSGGGFTHVYTILTGRGEGATSPASAVVDLDVTRPGGARPLVRRRVDVKV